MFCPNCGKSEQQSDTYCRQCGNFILDPSNKFYPLNIFLSNGNPEKQINFSIFISLATVVVSGLLCGFLFGYFEAHYQRTGESTPGIIYAVYVFLSLIILWQFLSVVISLQMKAKFKRRKEIDGKTSSDTPENDLPLDKTQELLPEADTRNLVDASVTENTTRNLTGEKRK